MDEARLQPGDVVAGLEPDEHVEIRRIAPFGARILIEGICETSRREIRRPLNPEDLSKIKVVRGNTYTYNGDASNFLLGVEAQRIRIAYQFDPLFAVNSSIVDILPHQVEAVYRYLLPLPRIRFLLADDTGAGKTIMTGLLIKELLFRGVISKVLIITPGGLTKQWQEDEMRDKFGLHFDLVNRASFDANPGQFSRHEEGFFITSIDFISRHEGCLNAARETLWDLIVVDEAHKLSAYEYGTKVERNDRYQAVESLAPRTDHLLFLTATPHRGRKDTFRRLLMLLDEDLFQKDEHVTQRIHEEVSHSGIGEDFDGEDRINKARNRFFLRRLKEEMVDWESGPLFKPRHTKTLGYELTPEELDLYQSVTRYVRSRRQVAKAKKNRNVELTLMVMQRRLASSIFAITRTLQNRKTALEEVLRILRDPARTAAEKKKILRTGDEDLPANIYEYEDLDETQRDGVDKRIFRQVLTDNPAEIEGELTEIKELLIKAESFRNHPEAKFTELLAVLDSSDVIRREDEKLIIFTEHKDTLDSLSNRLANRGYTIATIHGGMDIERRKQSQRDFRSSAKIMIATEAAGEGINLQFCRYLINWDIPWNPNRLEQRMGRIHRYGQKDDVWVYNLVAINTREGAVLQKILLKMDVMRDQMGTDRVYDVIDELLEEVPLVKLLERSLDAESDLAGAVETENYLTITLDNKAKELVELQKKQSLASRLDLVEARRLRDVSDEHRLQPLFIQRFFTTAYTAAGGTIQADKHFPVWHVGRPPGELTDVAHKQRIPLANKYDTPFVFDKELVSVASKIRIPEYTRMLGPGHPLFDALIMWTLRRARESFTKGVVVVDPNVSQPRQSWLVYSKVDDGRREEKKRLAHEQLSLVLADEGGFLATSSAYLLNCTAPDNPGESVFLTNHTTEAVQMWAYEHLTEIQLEQVKGWRIAECDLRRHYLGTTFTDLILDLQDKLNDLQQAQLFGNEDDEKRAKLEKRIGQLKERKIQRLAELEQMMLLTADLPDVVTSALIVPAVASSTDVQSVTPGRGVPCHRDEEVEAIAMDQAMRYERHQGWTPTDVSKEGEHYDIRSESPTGERRYIEVKGRAQSGAIILTGPELDKLRQLGVRAWLYIVTFCKSEQPELHIIQDPAARLTPEMLYRQVQYIVQEGDWSSSAENIKGESG